MQKTIILMGCRVPVRNNIINNMNNIINEEAKNNINKVPLLIFINSEAYLKLIRKAALESLSQDDIVEKLIMLLDDKNKMEDVK